MKRICFFKKNWQNYIYIYIYIKSLLLEEKKLMQIIYWVGGLSDIYFVTQQKMKFKILKLLLIEYETRKV